MLMFFIMAASLTCRFLASDQDLEAEIMTLEEEIDMHGRMAMAIDIIEGCPEFANLIPEVRTNLVYARTNAKTREEVMAIEGRVTVVSGKPHAAGKPKFGASSHMARLIIEIRKTDPSLRSGMDFANNPHLAKWLEHYCQSMGWAFSVIDRRFEPEEIKEAEGSSMPWKVKAAIEAAGGKVPKIFYETGAVGKEPVSVLVGSEPVVVAQQVCEIARLYYGECQG
jgi:predicted fused transcriptional regulator/phosphomethylpyrimidine kinase